MAELLLGTDLNAQQLKLAETLFRSGESLLGVLNDILDFSKIEAGKLDLEQTDFDLRDNVEELMELLAVNAHRKGLEFICRIDDDVPAGVRGDSGRIRQVLANLIGNAIKFTEQGEIFVHASLLDETPDDILVGFEVRDTGIGIPLQAQSKIFEPFSQSDQSMNRRFGGTGLGLSISRQLCEMMGGHIELESTRGKGSIFRFTIRLKREQPEKSDAKRFSPLKLHNLRVLVVEDNQTAREVLKGQLESWEMSCECAESGEKALEMLHDAAGSGKAYAMAIMDMMIPGIGGHELATRIKKDPSLASVALIVTGGDIERSPHPGVAAYLMKPVRPSQLYNAIVDSLKCRQSVKPEISEDLAPVEPILAPILLAEDNPTNQHVCTAMLKKLGCRRVDVVLNGRHALEALSRTDYGLVLMDCQMPDMDGYEATRKFREMEKAKGTASRTSIVALTAHAMKGSKEQCLDAGMDDYVFKPFTLSQLKTALDRWLVKKPDSVSSITDVDRTDCEVAGGKRNEEIIDRTVLKDIMMLCDRNGDRQLLEEVLNSFVDYSDDLFKQIDLDSDREQIRKMAHSLKSSSANIGAMRLCELCKKIETACQSPNGLTRKSWSKMETEYRKVRKDIEKILAQGI